MDWRFDRGKPLWLRVIVGNVLGCLVVYTYGNFIRIVADKMRLFKDTREKFFFKLACVLLVLYLVLNGWSF